MPQGLEVYGPDGSLWVGTTDYVGKLRGKVDSTPSSSSGSQVTVPAPGASTLTAPFCVLTGNQIQQYIAMSSLPGNPSMTLHSFAAASAYVNDGQDSITLSAPWSFLVYRACTIWYGDR